MDPGSPLRCVRDDPRVSGAIRLAVVLACLALQSGPAFAEVKSGSEFLSPEMRRQQADEIRNPAYFWVEQGRDLFSRKPAPDRRR
jgi:sulfur-oxidizing protein SoxA